MPSNKYTKLHHMLNKGLTFEDDKICTSFVKILTIYKLINAALAQIPVADLFRM